MPGGIEESYAGYVIPCRETDAGWVLYLGVSDKGVLSCFGGGIDKEDRIPAGGRASRFAALREAFEETRIGNTSAHVFHCSYGTFGKADVELEFLCTAGYGPDQSDFFFTRADMGPYRKAADIPTSGLAKFKPSAAVEMKAVLEIPAAVWVAASREATGQKCCQKIVAAVQPVTPANAMMIFPLQNFLPTALKVGVGTPQERSSTWDAIHAMAKKVAAGVLTKPRLAKPGADDPVHRKSAAELKNEKDAKKNEKTPPDHGNAAAGTAAARPPSPPPAAKPAPPVKDAKCKKCSKCKGWAPLSRDGKSDESACANCVHPAWDHR